MSLVSMASRAVLVASVYDVTLASLHLDRAWQWYSCSSRGVLLAALIDLYSTQLTGVFGHLQPMRVARSSMRIVILIRQMTRCRIKILVTLVVILPSMT